MNIDFIKWMCDKAEDYSIVCMGDIARFRYQGKQNYDYVLGWSLPISDWCFYPLLLQRAIEGVNRTDKTYTIAITEMVCVFEYLPEDDGIWFKDAKSIDEEKESALMYIYEQDNK